MAGETSVLLNDPDGEHIQLSFPDGQWHSTDGWLHVEVSIRVSSFRADLPMDLQIPELVALRDALTRLAKRRSTGEEWKSLESNLFLRMDGEKVDGVATERVPDGNSLAFSMPLTSHAIEEAVRQLDRLLLEYT